MRRKNRDRPAVFQVTNVRFVRRALIRNTREEDGGFLNITATGEGTQIPDVSRKPNRPLVRAHHFKD